MKTKPKPRSREHQAWREAFDKFFERKGTPTKQWKKGKVKG